MGAKESIAKIEANLAANPDLASSINAVFQFSIEGEGDWTLNLKEAPGSITEGATDGADCTIIMAAEDFEAMINKTANPMQLYMSQKLKVQGNLPLSLKLQEIIK